MKGIHLSYLRSFTLTTRKPAYGILFLSLISWACIGPATGHMFVVLGRNAMVHFSGLSAYLFSAAVFATAGVLMLRLFVRDEVRRKKHRPAIRRLLISCLIFLGLAITIKLTGKFDALAIQPGHAGVFSDDTLQRFLLFPGVKVFAETWRSYAFAWLLKSCLLLIVVAIICKLFGATKESMERHPSISLFFFLVFGLPFLTIWSLMLIEYTFYDLPSRYHSVGPAAYAQYLAHSLSMLTMFTAIWLFSALITVVLVVRAFGGKVQWQTEEFADTLPSA